MTITTLQDYIDDIANTDSDSYSATNKKAALTRWAHILTEEVIDAQDDWDFQGEIATADLAANQREYSFPSDILKIKRIDLMLDGSNWTRTYWIDESEIQSSIASESDIAENFDNSEPYIALMDDSFFIFSGTITAVTAGIKIWYSEEIVGKDTTGADVTSFTADTDTPNIRAFAQMGLVYGSVLDWAETRDPALANRMNIRLFGYSGGRPADSASTGGIMGRVRNFYSRRIADKKILISSLSSIENYE